MTRTPAERLDRAGYPATVEIPVLYGDLDPNRHVNNVSMGRFFEHARVVMLTAVRESTPDLHFLVGRVAIDYLSEGRFGEMMTVGTRPASVGRTSLRLEQVAWQGARAVAVCETVLVRVRDGAPVPLPESVRDWVTERRPAGP